MLRSQSPIFWKFPVLPWQLNYLGKPVLPRQCHGTAICPTAGTQCPYQWHGPVWKGRKETEHPCVLCCVGSRLLLRIRMTLVKCVKSTHVSEQRTRAASVKHVCCSNCTMLTRHLCSSCPKHALSPSQTPVMIPSPRLTCLITTILSISQLEH